jgi:hypothetical protein
MNGFPLLRQAAAFGSVIGFLAYSAAAYGGNMTLTFDGVANPVEVLSFKFGATNPGDLGGGGGTGKVAFSAFSFTAPESAVSPLEFFWVNTGRHVKEAVLQVRAPDGTRLLSEWNFRDVMLESFGAESGPLDAKAKAPNTFQPPQTSFNLRFVLVCYKVFAADGSVAGQTCYDVKTAEAR